MALCNFIYLIPRMTSIPCPLRMIRFMLNTLPDHSSGTFWAMQSASTQPLGILITYGAPEATSANFALLAHAKLIKSCHALESNSIMMGHSLKKNVPISTSSPVGISSMV
jgi:hypothetical protein